MGSATAIEPAIRTAPASSVEASEETLAIPADMLYEVIDGNIVEKIMSVPQAEVAGFLTGFLVPFVRANRLGRILPENMFLIRSTRDHQRRPDIAFVSNAQWPFQKRGPKVAVWDLTPALPIEIVSPSDSAYEVQEKIQEYFTAGAVEVWIIYPEHRKLHRFRSTTQIEILQPGDELDGAPLLPGFKMPLSMLFEDDPE